MVSKKERGQVIILIAAGIVLLVAMAGLIVDGGNAYLNRRSAQTAADAAALAAAYEYCVNDGSMNSIEAVATKYATVLNDATAVIQPDGGNGVVLTSDEVTVYTQITADTFFAKILGIPQETVSAKASASCFNPKGVGAGDDIMPIAWACRPPEGEEPEEDCVLQKIPYAVFEQIESSGFNFSQYLLDVGDGSTASSYQTDIGGTDEGKMIYVIMDTDKFDPEDDCAEADNGGSIICDFNGDDIYDVGSGAERGWLWLEGKTGADALRDVMTSGVTSPVEINSWYPGETGVKNTVFDAAKDHRLGRIALVPVFDVICADIHADDFDTDCAPYDPGVDQIFGRNGKKTYYHVIAFAPFYVSCVAKNNESCPGKDFAGIDKSTIEGYFVDGYIVDSEIGGSFDLGVYILSLTE